MLGLGNSSPFFCAELMILGFISLLLTFGQSYVSRICIPQKVADTMLPCRYDNKKAESSKGGHRRLLWYERRSLAAGSYAPSCKTVFRDMSFFHGFFFNQICWTIIWAFLNDKWKMLTCATRVAIRPVFPWSSCTNQSFPSPENRIGFAGSLGIYLIFFGYRGTNRLYQSTDCISYTSWYSSWQSFTCCTVQSQWCLGGWRFVKMFFCTRDWAFC